jgi:hypothetical protein
VTDIPSISLASQGVRIAARAAWSITIDAATTVPSIEDGQEPGCERRLAVRDGQVLDVDERHDGRDGGHQ